MNLIINDGKPVFIDTSSIERERYLQIKRELDKQCDDLSPNKAYIKTIVDIYIKILMWKFYGKITDEQFIETKELIEQLNQLILKRRIFEHV